MPRKNLDAQFIFQLNDGFGHAWLRGVQRFGGLRQIQVSAGSFLDKAKLMQVHINKPSKIGFIMPY